MESAVLTGGSFPWLSIVALSLFALVFVGLLIRVFSKSTKNLYEEASQLPLNDEGDRVSK